MGSGIKMHSALDANGQVLTVAALRALHEKKTPLPALSCLDARCSAAVRFVPDHVRSDRDGRDVVHACAYVGLTSHSRHVPGCDYDAQGCLTIIAATADTDFMGALDDGGRELRLPLLHNGLKTASATAAAASAPAASKGPAVGHHYIASGQKLASYLRTTAELLALRQRCDSDALLAAELKLSFGKTKVPWTRFFFEQDRIDEAWRLARQKGAGMHPMALVGQVASHQPASHGPGPMYLNCRALYRRTDDPDVMESFAVSVLHDDAAWLQGFAVGSTIVMFGLWSCKGPDRTQAPARNNKSRIVTYLNHKLVLRPWFLAQVLAA